MKWTQRHSRNALAAKARKRLQPTNPTREVRNRVRLRRGRAKWRLQLRDLEHGDSLTLTLSRLPWPARYLDQRGREHSAASLSLFVRTLLRHAP